MFIINSSKKNTKGYCLIIQVLTQIWGYRRTTNKTNNYQLIMNFYLSMITNTIKNSTLNNLNSSNSNPNKSSLIQTIIHHNRSLLNLYHNLFSLNLPPTKMSKTISSLPTITMYLIITALPIPYSINLTSSKNHIWTLLYS